MSLSKGLRVGISAASTAPVAWGKGLNSRTGLVSSVSSGDSGRYAAFNDSVEPDVT